MPIAVQPNLVGWETWPPLHNYRMAQPPLPEIELITCDWHPLDRCLYSIPMDWVDRVQVRRYLAYLLRQSGHVLAGLPAQGVREKAAFELALFRRRMLESAEQLARYRQRVLRGGPIESPEERLEVAQTVITTGDHNRLTASWEAVLLEQERMQLGMAGPEEEPWP